MNRLLAVTFVTACLCAIGGCGGSMGSAGNSGGSGGQSSAVPTASNGSLAATMGAATTGTLSGQGSGTLTYAISTPPQDGTATLTNPATGVFTYTSYPNFTGNDSLQFTVTDSTGASQPATETLQVTSPALGAQQTVANIGTATDWVCYWCVAQPFVNVVRQAANFGDPTTGAALAEEGKLDAQGWPESDFRWMVLCCVKADGSATDPGPTSPLAGNYQLSFNGEAKIWDDGGTVEDQQYDATTNTTTATLAQSGTNGFDMLLGFSNTQRSAASATDTGITNIQIIRPQFAPNGTKWWDSPSQEFTDPFLASFQGMSTIRYINWTKVIGSPEVNWSDRTPANWPVAGYLMEAPQSSLPYLAGQSNCTQYCDWFGTGMNWESAIDLANATHTDMWINIPAMATDDYVKNLAALIKSRLDPGLHVYVEWSDEIWNFGNPYWTETNYNDDQVTALLASNPTEAANYAANCASFATGECHVAERVMQFGQDFASVYGQAAINATIRPVLCTQVTQPVFLMEALGFIADTYGSPANYFYGICGAPYWYPDGTASTLPSGATQAGVVAALASGIPPTASYLQADTAVALYYGLHNLTYEGGPDYTNITITGDTAAQQNATMQAAMLEPAMKSQVVQGMTSAFQDGIDLYMYYSIAGSGAYGALLDQTDLAVPKFAGLEALVGQLITRTAGVAVPGNIPANQPLFGTKPDGTARSTFEATGWYFPQATASNPASAAFNGSGPVGSGLGYLIHVTKAGTYSVSLVMDDGSRNFPSTIECDVDQKSIGTFTVPETPGGTPLTVGPLTVTLNPGLHLVEIKNATNPASQGFAIHSINFTAN